MEEAVKRVASYRAPGRLHVDAALRGEGAELLRAAEAEAPATVRTPPLRVPSSVGFASSGGVIDRDIAAGLTDEEGGNTPDRAGRRGETAATWRTEASAEDGVAASPSSSRRGRRRRVDGVHPRGEGGEGGNERGAFRGDGDRSDATRIGDAMARPPSVRQTRNFVGGERRSIASTRRTPRRTRRWRRTRGSSRRFGSEETRRWREERRRRRV